MVQCVYPAYFSFYINLTHTWWGLVLLIKSTVHANPLWQKSSVGGQKILGLFFEAGDFLDWRSYTVPKQRTCRITEPRCKPFTVSLLHCLSLFMMRTLQLAITHQYKPAGRMLAKDRSSAFIACWAWGLSGTRFLSVLLAAEAPADAFGLGRPLWSSYIFGDGNGGSYINPRGGHTPLDSPWLAEAAWHSNL